MKPGHLAIGGLLSALFTALILGIGLGTGFKVVEKADEKITELDIPRRTQKASLGLQRTSKKGFKALMERRVFSTLKNKFTNKFRKEPQAVAETPTPPTVVETTPPQSPIADKFHQGKSSARHKPTTA